jgi:hypothetical protein
VDFGALQKPYQKKMAMKSFAKIVTMKRIKVSVIFATETLIPQAAGKAATNISPSAGVRALTWQERLPHNRRTSMNLIN